MRPSTDIGRIHPRERDFPLRIDRDSWAKDIGPQLRERGWNSGGDDRGQPEYIWRVMREEIDKEGKPIFVAQREEESAPDHLLEVAMRFPSAPIYGIHRKYEYQYTLRPRMNYHTIRLLRRYTSFEKPMPPLRRIYLFHNGLNEIDRLTFHYQLANVLLDEESGCLIRPMPGHLTRFPLPLTYAETPMDRYLSDSGDLFRQFLRFMLESQWLLSILVPLPFYGAVSGLELLAQSDGQNKGRLDADTLSGEILQAWDKAYAASESSNRQVGERVERDAIKNTILTLRHLIGWREPDSFKADEPPSPDMLTPCLHAVGYSIGGYLAQSVFFSWPYAISSCIPMFAGGALREIAPTVFAHAEEWQTVMYSLRYELESDMLDSRLQKQEGAGGEDLIAGMDANYYAFFDRVFNDVFLQDFRSFYRSRLSEYVDRLLFVVSGGDPIVSLPSLIESSPPQGINMIQVPGVPHLIERAGKEWRTFWLKETGRVVRHYSPWTEDILANTLRDNWWKRDYTSPVSEESDSGGMGRDGG